MVVLEIVRLLRYADHILMCCSVCNITEIELFEIYNIKARIIYSYNREQKSYGHD